MSEDLPKAISESVVHVGGAKIRVYNLDNGMRVFDAEDVQKIFGSIRYPDPDCECTGCGGIFPESELTSGACKTCFNGQTRDEDD